jgi:hypothetical protein
VRQYAEKDGLAGVLIGARKLKELEERKLARLNTIKAEERSRFERLKTEMKQKKKGASEFKHAKKVNIKKVFSKLKTPAEMVKEPKNLSFSDAIPYIAFNEKEAMIADEVAVGKNEFEGEQLKYLPPKFYIRRKSCCCRDCKLFKEMPGFAIVLDQDHPGYFQKLRRQMMRKAMKKAGKAGILMKALN